jgi:3-hydroxybutyryl-CoA dehydrogenase
MDTIRTVGIVGAGTMGNGIAHVAARAGLKVVLFDIEQHYLDRALSTISKNMERELRKGKLDATEKRRALERIRPTLEIDTLADADFIVEAIVEALEPKQLLFKDLESICRPEIVFASNTSSLSITKIASATERPSRMIGMHFMNPVPVMSLVEIVWGLETSPETIARTRELAIQFGKTPVEVKDCPGFVSNRVLMPMINEAIFCLMEDVASAEDIDTVMRLGMNHPIGPLALADMIGLDVCLNIMEILEEGFDNPKYSPCPLLRKMVEEGCLGRKSSQGFYTY